MKDKVKNIVAEILDIESADIKEDALILDDLGADSIAVMEIVMELEEVLEVPGAYFLVYYVIYTKL